MLTQHITTDFNIHYIYMYCYKEKNSIEQCDIRTFRSQNQCFFFLFIK